MIYNPILEIFPYYFQIMDITPRLKLYNWCEYKFGASAGLSGWKKSVWIQYGITFYFKNRDDCILAKLTCDYDKRE